MSAWFQFGKILGVITLLASTAGGSVAAETRIPPERLLFKDVIGSVVDPATGKPMAGVAVSLLYETAVTDQNGKFRFAKVPLSHTAQVSMRVRSKIGYIIGCTVVDVPVRFYPIAVSEGDKIDVQIVDPGTDEAITLSPKPVASSKIGAYCATCHDRNPCIETATFQELVKSGAMDLRGIIVNEEEVENYKARLVQQGLRRESYQRIRYQDSHPDGMNMDIIPELDLIEYKGRFKKTQTLRLVEDKVVTCDTCHTRHLPTDQTQYVVMSFERDSALCVQCHL